MPYLPEASILVLAPFAPLFSQRVWLPAQLLLLGALLAPGAHTMTAVLRVMGWAMERRFTTSHRVLTRATWSARQGSRMLGGCLLTVLVVAGGFAAGSLALAWVKSQVVRGSRLRWDAARYHQPGPQPPGKRGAKPTKGKRQRSLQRWAERSDTPGEDVAVTWDSGQRHPLWGFSHTALWDTPGLPPAWPV